MLTGKLLLVVAIHTLGGSRANWYHTPNPQYGAAQPTQDEDHTSHEQSTRVPFRSPLRKGQEPFTITTIGARDNHHPPLNDPRCSKPSRWRHLGFHQFTKTKLELSDEPLYLHISRALSTNGATRWWYRVWNTRTPSRPRRTSF